MPTNRKRSFGRRRMDAFAPGHVAALSRMHDYFREFGERGPEADSAMARAWPILRARVFEYHREHGKSIMPGGWWRFESSEPRDPDLSEAEQLARMGIDAKDSDT